MTLVEMSAPTLAVSEVFGPTVQGEGPSVGRRCAFVRLARCNLSCSWCDTPYTWDWDRYDPRAEIVEQAPEDVAAEVTAMGVDMLVLTGGEPLLQQRRAVMGLLDAIPPHVRVEVETNGTVPPTHVLSRRVDAFNVSPKLAHSGDPACERVRPRAIAALRDTGKAVWKFVAADPDDLAEVASIVNAFDLAPVYVMPLGTDSDALTSRLAGLADAVIARGWNLTPRMHVDIWGGRRGV